MRIGIDCRMYSSAFTGIGRYTYELVNRLAKTDNENEYFLFFNEPQYSEVDAAFENKRFHKILVGAKHYSFKEQTVFLKKIRDAKLDLMHFTHFNAPILYRGKSVVTIHDLTLSYYPGKKMASMAHRAAYHLVINSITKRAKKIIAVSKNTKNDLINLLNVPTEKIEVIYEGVGSEFKEIKDAGILAKLRDKYKIDERFLLYTGVWRSHKN
ncbi:glycosyltransferase, partial [Patescibacteria group bacterium]|nr:glycosyltransferase [Patescibacteria group bacterium]